MWLGTEAQPSFPFLLLRLLFGSLKTFMSLFMWAASITFLPSLYLCKKKKLYQSATAKQYI